MSCPVSLCAALSFNVPYHQLSTPPKLTPLRSTVQDHWDNFPILTLYPLIILKSLWIQK